MADWSLFSRGPDYRNTGGLRLTSAKAVVRHMAYDTAVIETPYSPEAFARTAPGCGFILNRNGVTEFSGLVGSERTTGQDTDGGPTIKVMCVGDNVHLADRIVYPDPARAGDDQVTADYWQTTAPASTAMFQLVQQQVGRFARDERRVPGLGTGDEPGVGTSRLWSFLMTDTVMTALQQMSLLSGADLGVRLRSVGDGLRFDVYQPRQLASNIRFSASLGNLTSWSYTETAPKKTYVVAAGQGDLHLRMRRAATATDPLDLRWGRRIESQLDRRDEADANVLAQAAADDLADSKGQVSLACTLTDSQAATYGRDWGLGDQVTVYVGVPNQSAFATVADVVREIAFDVTNTGAEVITPAVGTADASSIFPTPSQQRLADIGDVLRNLSRK